MTREEAETLLYDYVVALMAAALSKPDGSQRDDEANRLRELILKALTTEH